MCVPDVQAADTACEVDEGVAVDVGQRGALTALDHNREGERQRLGDDPLFPLENPAGAGLSTSVRRSIVLVVAIALTIAEQSAFAY